MMPPSEKTPKADAPQKVAPKRAKSRGRKKSTPLKRKGKQLTPKQLENQERAFTLHLESKTYREISVDLGVSMRTIVSYIRREQERRSDELQARRASEQSRSIAFYERVIARALKKGDFYDDLLGERAGAKISDHTLEVVVKARERIDKLLGLDAPTKIDVGMQTLIDALEPK